jgi:hydroxypyruvate reductase 1
MVMWLTENPDGMYRVVLTRKLPGERWMQLLLGAGCRVDVWDSREAPTPGDIADAVGDRCDALVGQLTETWDEPMLAQLGSAGVRVYANYAVGFNNVDVDAASRLGIAVTNTPGVLTTTTAELAVGLTLAAARRLVEGDAMVRSGRFTGWEPGLMLGKQLSGKVLGVVGAGRTGSAYARMMVYGFGMSLLYHGPNRKPELEKAIGTYGDCVPDGAHRVLPCRFVPVLDDLLVDADVVSLHPPLNESTRHLLNRERLRVMKPDAVLVNVSRGPVIDEAALVAHCRENPRFRVGLDVFEDEPALTPGLAELPNVVLAPHIGSASTWTRESMSALAAHNVVGVLKGYPVWDQPAFDAFLSGDPPRCTPSVVNPEVLGLG